MTTKDTKHNLMFVKKNIVERYMKKLLTRVEVAKLLGMHPNAVSRLKDNYQKHGDGVLVGRKTGPKPGFRPHNRTSEQLEELIAQEGSKHPEWGPLPLADHLSETYSITINQTTIWRVLARKKIRYTTTYKRFVQEPKLYCLDTPGKVLQMDACYPFGRSRDLASFDAIDDCSRKIYGRAYDTENDQNAMDFVTRLVKTVPFTIQMIKVDNRYGQDFKTYVEQVLHIKVHYNDPYCPQQNGKIERFHKTLKQEFYHKYIAFTDSFDTINYKYALWQGYYNTKRKHSGYGMNQLTPQQKLIQATYQGMANYIINHPQKVTLTLQQYIVCIQEISML
jgi:IS30 family transposase